MARKWSPWIRGGLSFRNLSWGLSVLSTTVVGRGLACQQHWVFTMVVPWITPQHQVMKRHKRGSISSDSFSSVTIFFVIFFFVSYGDAIPNQPLGPDNHSKTPQNQGMRKSVNWNTAYAVPTDFIRTPLFPYDCMFNGYQFNEKDRTNRLFKGK